jgi:3D (Asp-Asp-Asp) domain-containing protein
VVIAGSFWRKVVVTVIAASGFAALHDVTIPDSRYVGRFLVPSDPTAAPPAPGERVNFSATAYCKGETTASGVQVRTGIAAADPTLLPVGSVIDVAARNPKYSGVYTVMDTGPAIKGRVIDVYMWSCYEALEFGRMPVEVTVLRLGWNPQATSSSSFLDRLFKRQSAPPNPPPPAVTTGSLGPS